MEPKKLPHSRNFLCGSSSYALRCVVNDKVSKPSWSFVNIKKQFINTPTILWELHRLYTLQQTAVTNTHNQDTILDGARHSSTQPTRSSFNTVPLESLTIKITSCISSNKAHGFNNGQKDSRIIELLCFFPVSLAAVSIQPLW